MLATNNTDDPFKTSLDLGVGVVSFFGPIGLGMSAVYFGIDTFYPGGIYQFSTDYVNQQMDFYNSVGFFSIRTYMH